MEGNLSRWLTNEQPNWLRHHCIVDVHVLAFFHFMAHVLFASRHLSLQLSELIVVDELPTYLAVKIVLIELGSFVDIELSHLFLDDSYFLQFYVVGFQSLVMEF